LIKKKTITVYLHYQSAHVFGNFVTG